MDEKGYPTPTGYMGYLPEDPNANEDGYVYFASESDYLEIKREIKS